MDSRAPLLDLTASATDLTRTLCDLESVSGGEKPVADAIEQALRGHPHLEVIRDGDTVIARTQLGRAHRVIIAGHIDTVPINHNLPCTDELIDGVPYLVGRGTVDMKAGVAVQLKLAAELTAPRVDVTWMWYDHEEVGSELNGLGRVARTRPELFVGDFAILGEPSNSAVEGGCNGTLQAEIRATGIRAHSARNWVGANAIHAIAPALAVLNDYRARTVPVEGLDYREGLSAVAISGGVAGNVIPDLCTLTVNYRFAPDRTIEEASAHLRDVFAGFEVTVVDAVAGARPGLDSPLTRSFVDAVGGEAKPKYGWTDVARFSALGIPAVNYGPGDPVKAHADDERVAIPQIVECERGLRAFLTAQ